MKEDILENLPDYQETYDLYKGRRPEILDDSVAEKKLDFHNRESTEAELYVFASQCGNRFLDINEDSPSANVETSKHDYKRTNMKIGEQVIDPNIPLRVLAYKVFVDDRGSKSEKILFRLDKGSEDQPVAVISAIYSKDKDLNINHRFVEPPFRGKQGVGSMILRCVESFAKSFLADKHGFAEVAQLDVIFWFWKNGYRPKNKKDWEALDKIVNGDETLCLSDRLYIFKDSVPEDDRYEKDGAGQFIIENGKKSIDPKKAFGLEMIKPFEPNAYVEVKAIQTNTKEALDELWK